MFYKIGLCDDDSYFLDSLKIAIQKYEQTHSLTFQIFTYASGEELLDKYHEQYFHLLLLDMEMANLSGIDVAKKLRQSHDNISIIYTTAHENYALQAFQVAADSYLLKPFTEDLLFTALDRVFHKLTLQTNYQDRHDLHFSLTSPSGIIQLSYAEILYISKMRNLLTFYTTTNQYPVYMNIKDILKKLDTTVFVKINQGQIVNWNKITALNDNVIFIGDIELSISRSHSSRLTKRYRQELEQLLRLKENI